MEPITAPAMAPPDIPESPFDAAVELDTDDVEDPEEVDEVGEDVEAGAFGLYRIETARAFNPIYKAHELVDTT
jgi:hypothetical protein